MLLLTLWGVVLGIAGARFLLVGLALSLLPWGLTAALIGYSSRSRGSTISVAASYGFAVAFSGTGKSADADDAQRMCAALQARVSELFGDTAAAGVRLLYGGSAKPENARSTLWQADVDGALGGRSEPGHGGLHGDRASGHAAALRVTQRHRTSRSRH